MEKASPGLRKKVQQALDRAAADIHTRHMNSTGNTMLHDLLGTRWRFLSVPFLAIFCVGFRLCAAPADGPGALIITEADSGRTIRVAPGRTIEIRLNGDEAATGWEASAVSGKAIEREGAQPGEVNASATPRFTPARDARDKALGSYVFRYRAVAEGKAGLRFVYVFPGGPEVFRRTATKLVRRMEVTVEVVKDAGGGAEK